MQHKVKKSYIDSQFGQLHFQVFGSGKPLILCHQSPSSLEMFNSAYPVLASLGVQSIGIDTPGYGQSDSPNQQPSILDYAECVIDVIESLNLEKVSLLGHHTGACIVAELAVIRPDLVDKVILNGTDSTSSNANDGLVAEDYTSDIAVYTQAGSSTGTASVLNGVTVAAS